MSKYRVFLTDAFNKSLKRVDRGARQRISAKLQTQVWPALKVEPHFGLQIKKLRSWTPDTWRYRVGNYRIFYTIDEQERVVVVLTIDHRQSAYRQ